MLYNIKKEFLVLLRSNFFIVLLFTIVIYYFFYYITFNTEIKIYIKADNKIKKIFSTFLVKENLVKIVNSEDKSDIIIIVDSSDEIWEVDIKAKNIFASKIIPIINYILYKTYFSIHNKIEPINFIVSLPTVNIENFKTKNLIALIKNFVVFLFLSHILFDVYLEKKNKTILIYLNNYMGIFKFILGKIITLTITFALILLVFNFFIYYNLMGFMIIILNFIFLLILFALLSLLIQNKYYINLINFFLVFIPMLTFFYNNDNFIITKLFLIFSNNFELVQKDYYFLAFGNLFAIALLFIIFLKFKNFIALKVLNQSE